MTLDRRSGTSDEITETRTGSTTAPKDMSRALVGPRYRAEKSGTVVASDLVRRDGTTVTSRGGPVPPGLSPDQEGLARAFDRAYLRSTRRNVRRVGPTIRIADLFSGCGLMSEGAATACYRVGATFEPVLAVDLNAAAIATYRRNFPNADAKSANINSVLDGRLGGRLTAAERALARTVKSIDLVLGGPPCQGHSDLNNHTRRDDPKNALYLRMARFAEVVAPRHMIIENVPAVRHDKSGVVDRTLEQLVRLGYWVFQAVLDPVLLGVPQRRRRHFMLATTRKIDVLADLTAYHRTPRSVRWAIEDLEVSTRERVIDQVASPTKAARERIDHLFDTDTHDLPNSMRPSCHRDHAHTYLSVYGRMRYDEPAQTITTGFYCMGQGRFVHPTQRRTITAHEAARLQFVPDYFEFGENVRRTALAEMVGNGVPTKLIEVLSTILLR